MTEKQKAMLPDLVALAMIGFSMLKSDRGASEWQHPAIAAFRAEVEPTFNKRKDDQMKAWRRQYGLEGSVRE